MSDSGNSPLFAEIAIFSALEKTFHYQVPPELRYSVQTGKRCLIPLGRREVVGLIIALQDNPPDLSGEITFRPLRAVLDPFPVLPPDLISLCKWISNYYFYPLGDVLQACLPAGIQHSPRICFRLTPKGQENLSEKNFSEILLFLSGPDKLSTEEIMERSLGQDRKRLRKDLTFLEREGWIERIFEWKAPPAGSKKVRTVHLIDSPDIHDPKTSRNLRHFITILKEAGGSLTLRDLRRQVNNSDYWVRKLEQEGFLRIEDIETLRESQYAQEIPIETPPSLTSDQKQIADTIFPYITRSTFQPFLIHGVTGSGKTEIYLHLAEKALEQKKGVLVLVPEIALSTQLEALFRQRFGLRLAVWHSGLSCGTRYDQWRQILEGKREIVLGVRSAVFMPVARLGLIIVDEEHDTSYKQEDRLRYHARDVALMRASMLGIPIVLGSATPSLQSVYHTRSNRYMSLSLPRRILDRPLPSLELVDMRREKGKYRILSRPLQEALSETVENRRQAILFLNRRGFSTFFLCRTCGNVIQCSHCSVSLTYHQKEDRLRCHYCGCEKEVPERCPSCDHPTLIPYGFGTERVEEEVRLLLPKARLVRIDRDTVSHSGQISELLNAVRYRQADVLVGTQMIAKGHDFPGVTLVGVINADTTLQIPDFRAGEATVQILLQVAGRAGRGELPGRVILQTYNPHHYTIQSALNMDYSGFCSKELASREQLQYPPYTRMLKMLITSPDENVTKEAAYKLASLCRETASRSQYIAVLGPAPAPLAKLKNRFRWHIYLKAWTSQDLQKFTETILKQAKTYSLPKHVQLAIDRDPVSGF